MSTSAQLFVHYYLDSYPSGTPSPDPSRFEYLELVSSATDFRFHAHVAQPSLLKRRALSTQMGQAFCQLMLANHFEMAHFVHRNDVLSKPAHAAFGSLRVERICRGDVPHLSMPAWSGGAARRSKGTRPSLKRWAANGAMSGPGVGPICFACRALPTGSIPRSLKQCVLLAPRFRDSRRLARDTA
jgi:hypothetical protein